MQRLQSRRTSRLVFSRLTRFMLGIASVALIMNGIYRTFEQISNAEDEEPHAKSPFIKPEAHRRQLRGEETARESIINEQGNPAIGVIGEVYGEGDVQNNGDLHNIKRKQKLNGRQNHKGLPCAWVPELPSEGARHYPTRVLRHFGYHIRYRDEDFKPCDIIWTFDYPFWDKCWSLALVEYVTKHLKRHQRVNHFPGIGFVANKGTLALEGCDHCPPAFLLPDQKDDFQRAVQQHPDWQWVLKNQGHRGINLVKTEDVNVDKIGLVQNFIQNPLLIDGRKFDFSVYVVMLSLNPLRVYMYDADWAARFCKTTYEPFDPTDNSKYVVYGTDHVPIWEMASLRQSWDRGYGFKKSLLIHLRSRGFDTEKFVNDVKHVIGSTVRQKESNMLDTVKFAFKSHNDTRNLFELVRFDLIVDDELKVYLMEVNMSPDLETDDTNPRGKLYTNFLHDLFSMMGIPRVVRSTGIHDRTTDLMKMETNIRVFLPACFSRECEDDCKNELCGICPQCLTNMAETDLYTAFKEHSYRRGFRRVVPEPFKNQEDAKEWTITQHPYFNEWSPSNKLMFSWFRGKCIDDITWCS